MPSRVYRSPYPPIIPLEIDLVTRLFSNPNKTPDDKPIYIDAVTGISRTYGEIKRRTGSLAHGLRELGVKPRDIVAFISPNSIDYAIICYAILGCGATVSTVSAAYTALELQAQLETSGAKYLIAHSSLFDIAERATQAVPSVQLIQADGQRDHRGGHTAEFLAVTCPSSPLVSIKPEEASDRLSFMCFSSGTTGRAKGVMTTHANLVSNVQQWEAQLSEECTGDSTTVAFLPFSHIYGLTSFVCMNLLVGNTAVVLGRFDLELYLSLIQKYKPESVSVVPPIMLLLAKHPLVDKYDLSSLKRVLSAAAPLSTELREAVEARFKRMYGTTLLGLQAWGMTETSPLATAVPPTRPDKRHTVGNITPSMEFRVVDPETMQDTATDADGSAQAGEIWCRGPNVTKGYFRNEEATQSGLATDQDGVLWFRTGDIGYFDKDGFLIIVDRIKEMIKYKGLQVIPSELEGKLLEHPDIEDACVVGHWVEEQATELPVGFVVVTLKAKAKGDRAVVEDIHRWLNARVANHKRLRGGLYIVEAIPKSPSGKILRRQLKDSLKTKGSKGASKL
jgi:acyl-CoA synthetase (AMP-forming)/AMP-acid ligase II